MVTLPEKYCENIKRILGEKASSVIWKVLQKSRYMP